MAPPAKPQSRISNDGGNFMENLLSIMVLRAPWKAANCTLASVQERERPVSLFPNVRFLLSVAGVDSFRPTRGAKSRSPAAPIPASRAPSTRSSVRHGLARTSKHAGPNQTTELLRGRTRPATSSTCRVMDTPTAHAEERAQWTALIEALPAAREPCGPVPDRGYPAGYYASRTSSSSTGPRPPAGRCTCCSRSPTS